MTILALEFSSAQRSVALARDGRVLGDASETGGRGTQAFGLIERVLAAAKIGRAEIECLAIGLGPGSYTGIRVALAIAQGWQVATGVKLLGLSSVECVAAQAQAEKLSGLVNVVVDAQRGEFYLAAYRMTADGVSAVNPLKIVTANEAESRAAAGEIVTGPEITRWFPGGKIMFPQAKMLAALAASRSDFTPGERLAPIYLRETNFVKAPPARTMAA